MNNHLPLVSICVPTYNSANYLSECLDSIVNQTYKNCEIIVCDNASIDNTISIIQGYVEKHGFNYYRNVVNIGAGANFNKLIGLAKGEYIAIYHADDVYAETIIEESLNMFNKDNTIGLVGTTGNSIDEYGNLTGSLDLSKKIKSLNKSSYSLDDALVALTSRGWFFVTPSIMVRKKIYSELGLFELKRYGSACDYELWLRIAKKYPVSIIDKKLIRYRVHRKQGSEHEIRKNPEIPDIISVLQEYKDYTCNKKIKEQCKKWIQSQILKAARRQNYYGFFAKSNETLNLVNSSSLIPQKYMIKIFNVMGKSIKKRKL